MLSKPHVQLLKEEMSSSDKLVIWLRYPSGKKQTQETYFLTHLFFFQRTDEPISNKLNAHVRFIPPVNMFQVINSFHIRTRCVARAKWHPRMPLEEVNFLR